AMIPDARILKTPCPGLVLWRPLREPAFTVEDAHFPVFKLKVVHETAILQLHASPPVIVEPIRSCGPEANPFRARMRRVPVGVYCLDSPQIASGSTEHYFKPIVTKWIRHRVIGRMPYCVLKQPVTSLVSLSLQSLLLNCAARQPRHKLVLKQSEQDENRGR